MRRFIPIVFTMVSLAGGLFAEPVVKIYSEEITAKDLKLCRKEANRRIQEVFARTERGKQDQARLTQLSDALIPVTVTAYLFERIGAEYRQHQNIVISEEEVAQCLEWAQGHDFAGFQALFAAREQSPPKAQARIDQELRMLAFQMVAAYKLGKDLYSQFGGKVLAPSEGWPLPTPVEAIKQWVTSLEESNELIFEDPQLRDLLLNAPLFDLLDLADAEWDQRKDPFSCPFYIES